MSRTRVVPRGPVEPEQPGAVEHVGDSLDRAELAGGVPRARVARGREAAGVDLGRGEGRRRRLGVERVAVARLVRRQAPAASGSPGSKGHILQGRRLSPA